MWPMSVWLLVLVILWSPTDAHAAQGKLAVHWPTAAEAGRTVVITGSVPERLRASSAVALELKTHRAFERLVTSRPSRTGNFRVKFSAPATLDLVLLRIRVLRGHKTLAVRSKSLRLRRRASAPVTTAPQQTVAPTPSKPALPAPTVPSPLPSAPSPPPAGLQPAPTTSTSGLPPQPPAPEPTPPTQATYSATALPQASVTVRAPGGYALEVPAGTVERPARASITLLPTSGHRLQGPSARFHIDADWQDGRKAVVVRLPVNPDLGGVAAGLQPVVAHYPDSGDATYWWGDAITRDLSTGTVSLRTTGLSIFSSTALSASVLASVSRLEGSWTNASGIASGIAHDYLGLHADAPSCSALAPGTAASLEGPAFDSDQVFGDEPAIKGCVSPAVGGMVRWSLVNNTGAAIDLAFSGDATVVNFTQSGQLATDSLFAAYNGVRDYIPGHPPPDGVYSSKVTVPPGGGVVVTTPTDRPTPLQLTVNRGQTQVAFVTRQLSTLLGTVATTDGYYGLLNDCGWAYLLKDPSGLLSATTCLRSGVEELLDSSPATDTSATARKVIKEFEFLADVIYSNADAIELDQRPLDGTLTYTPPPGTPTSSPEPVTVPGSWPFTVPADSCIGTGLLPDAMGGVYADGCQSLVHFAADASHQQLASDQGETADVDPDGNLYRRPYVQGPSTTTSYESGGRTRWVSSGDDAARLTGALSIAGFSNGYAYFPHVGMTGSTIDRVAMSTGTSSTVPVATRLTLNPASGYAATNRGLIVSAGDAAYSTDRSLVLGYDGSVIAEHAWPEGFVRAATSDDATDMRFAVARTTHGALVRAELTCPTSFGATTSQLRIFSEDADGVQWSYSSPAVAAHNCVHDGDTFGVRSLEVEPTPDGGVVINADLDDPSAAALTSISSNGEVRWSIPTDFSEVDRAVTAQHDADFAVSQTGDVIYGRWQPCPDDSTCEIVSFTRKDAATGASSDIGSVTTDGILFASSFAPAVDAVYLATTSYRPSVGDDETTVFRIGAEGMRPRQSLALPAGP